MEVEVSADSHKVGRMSSKEGPRLRGSARPRMQPTADALMPDIPDRVTEAGRMSSKEGPRLRGSARPRMQPTADALELDIRENMTEADPMSIGEGPHAVGIGAPANAASRRHQDACVTKGAAEAAA